jgi:hypothetical protein
VRFSETLSFDPYTGQPLTALNDLHMFLGTTAANPVRTTGSTSTSGLIRDFLATGARDLGQITANRIETANLTFASSTNQVIVRDYMDTVNIISGRLELPADRYRRVQLVVQHCRAGRHGRRRWDVPRHLAPRGHGPQRPDRHLRHRPRPVRLGDQLA